MRKNGVKLRPRLVTAITVGVMIISTMVSSFAIIENSRIAKEIAYSREKEMRAQIIEKNMAIR